MKEKLSNAFALIIVAVLVIGVVYVVRVLPYGNDWSCVVAECRKLK